jgi:hypothetical protein
MASALMSVSVLSGCGTSDDGQASDDPSTRDNTSDDTAASSVPEEAGADAPDPVAVLPFEVEIPSGYRMLAASCDVEGTDDLDRPAGEASEPDDVSDYSTWITYAVPETWRSAGRSSGGSGSVTGTDEELTFRLDGVDGEVDIAVEWDSRDYDGAITGPNGEPWKSFDYTSTSADDETTITYEKVATVQAGDQSADLSTVIRRRPPISSRVRSTRSV